MPWVYTGQLNDEPLVQPWDEDLRRGPLMKRVKKIAFVGLTVMTVCILGLYGYWLWEQSGALFHLKSFDRDKWLSGGKIRSHTACLPGAYMAHDIVTRVIKPGMLRGEVVTLLGGPDLGESKIAYDLGMCIGYEYKSIIVHFNPEGKVERAEIR